jgi:cysteine-rich repeat protein
MPFVLLLGLAPILSSSLSSCSSSDAVCGDARVTGDEECDDGNLVETDDCTSTCKKAACGDGFTQAGNAEECDAGEANADTGDCTAKCTMNVCGDGAPLAGVEECDDGNLSNTDDCLETCLLATCGDGFVRLTTLTEDPPEGVLEACDDANDDDDDNCTTLCNKPTCGDGFVQAGEACDDGNQIDDDACPTSCQAPACGDGLVDPSSEECDDGNAIDTDACRNDCSDAACGDGVVHAGVEECDDGNAIDGDFCSSVCNKTCAGTVDPPPGTGLYEGRCYIYFPGPLAWPDANCNAFGMHLVDIQSLGENAFVKGLLDDVSADDAWIGLTDQAVESAWFWQLDQAGEVLLFPALQNTWGTAQPDNLPAPEADCGILDRTTSAWFDEPCDEVRGFVCEYEYPP